MPMQERNSNPVARILPAAALLMLSAFGTQAQSPTFEVASIRPNNSGDNRSGVLIVPGGSVRAINASLELLITTAYQIPDFELKDGPGWMRSERWDIDTKGSGNTPPEQVLQKLQSLLAERFHLQLHKETRELPIYALVVAKNGPKLEPSHAGSGL